ncbi:protein of unknown function DUF255 [Denitrovibrio acetiphilus DSM 12809]|uniref:Spermatogenesis-associated protein 20-like TRX domain-containing protein n=1 Tax=Denitrovibrio acetiphilus (strain DSM 12809 / NBRC 114555 / N2460) TaxID=522772 RepID=D4H8F4_DENA2|nr:DUF255 domain-containing protein [Denitrovibrio acetiphilus]ADD68303.1 protein of unknown function DUF255 [Denitrovibrio acetiphilus DSM 12809]
MQNKLINEKSLYLRQHAENPVAWQPYNNETLAMAKRENKPLFISIGYSSCHWCHVMAHETFEDTKAAEVINKNFIPIKIDREEHPEIDKKYQFYLQATGKRGGWPLSVFTLPDGRAFFGGTYFPPEPRHNLPSFTDITNQLGKLYREKPQEALKYAENYQKFHQKFIQAEHTVESLHELSADDILSIFKNMTDKEFGGIGTDAKFPNIPVLTSLMTYYEDTEVSDFLKMTADKMCTSGLYDHVNGGFYRYTVDREWHVPHFEKMLYDNAQNASFLLDMFEKTDNLLYLKVAEKTIDFILSEFNTEFGLISSMDADSPSDDGKNVEGFYYLVSEAHANPIKEHIDLYEGVVNVRTADYETYLILESHFEKLRTSNERQKPAKDTKVILSQNMLFCSALLRMFEMSGKEFYMEQATALIGKMKHLHMDEENLYRINYGGDIFNSITLEDYAFTVKTYLDFFEITNERPFLAEAASIAEAAIERFYAGGIFYLDSNKTIVDTFDDSTPNPSSLLAGLIDKYADFINIPKDKDMLDFASDRLTKYAGGHPTLFTYMKGYLAR